MTKKQIQLFREKLFKKIFGFKLENNPIGGLIIAEEKGMYDELEEYIEILKLVEPIIKKL